MKINKFEDWAGEVSTGNADDVLAYQDAVKAVREKLVAEDYSGALALIGEATRAAAHIGEDSKRDSAHREVQGLEASLEKKLPRKTPKGEMPSIIDETSNVIRTIGDHMGHQTKGDIQRRETPEA